jgi:hypothetical protein
MPQCIPTQHNNKKKKGLLREDILALVSIYKKSSSLLPKKNAQIRGAVCKRLDILYCLNSL